MMTTFFYRDTDGGRKKIEATIKDMGIDQPEISSKIEKGLQGGFNRCLGSGETDCYQKTAILSSFGVHILFPPLERKCIKQRFSGIFIRYQTQF